MERATRWVLINLPQVSNININMKYQLRLYVVAHEQQ